MEPMELLLADRVRTLAAKFRKAAFKQAWGELEESGEDIEAGMSKWKAENPHSAFIEAAFLELRGVAVQLRNLRSSG